MSFPNGLNGHASETGALIERPAPLPAHEPEPPSRFPYEAPTSVVAPGEKKRRVRVNAQGAPLPPPPRNPYK